MELQTSTSSFFNFRINDVLWIPNIRAACDLLFPVAFSTSWIYRCSNSLKVMN